MHFNKKICGVLAICLALGAAAGLYFYNNAKDNSGLENDRDRFSWLNNKETIYVYYSNDNMTDYLSSAAVSFGEENDARVIPVLASESEYLEAINKASIDKEQVPDLYLLSNDSLEKAYLAGLASEAVDGDEILNGDNFSDAALNAVTYDGKHIGYPLYFETSALIYNETYLEEWASQQAKKALEEYNNGADAGLPEEYADDEESVGDESFTDEAQSDGEEESLTPLDRIANDEFWAQDDETKIALLANEYLLEGIPKTVADVLSISDSFDPPETVEGMMEWDVSDIFYNYWFAGKYLNVGGECGDDKTKLDICNDEVYKSLETYAGLNQFFSMETDTISYDTVVEDFINGKIFFAIATTDIVKRLEDAKAEGSFGYEYGVCLLPDIDEALGSRSMSVTCAAVVNGYSENKNLANRFAAYITTDKAEELYTRTGKLACNKRNEYENGALDVFAQEYADSISLPKLLATENYWMYVEAMFAKIWNGSDVSGAVTELYEQMQIQFNE